MRWEYTYIVEYADSYPPDFLALGKDGWELVGMCGMPETQFTAWNVRYIFKRPLPPKPTRKESDPCTP